MLVQFAQQGTGLLQPKTGKEIKDQSKKIDSFLTKGISEFLLYWEKDNNNNNNNNNTHFGELFYRLEVMYIQNLFYRV